jgi:predicted cupin superfamily sugar epimerase/mannose-6-phosphate isomerase-like protein (cupin superfamily)
MERIPHEGAWFSLRWVSAERAAGGRRAAGNAILALVTRRDFSALHRLRSDETWHFHRGAPAELLLLHPDGRAELRRLGVAVLEGEEPQLTVPGGVWVGARPASPEDGAYSFFGCTLSPGFDEDDYEPGYRDELQADWPEAAGWIEEFTRTDSLTRPREAKAADGRPSGSIPPLDANRIVAPGAVPAREVGPGVTVREMVGRTGSVRAEALSIARFRLEAGASTGSSRYLGCDEFFLVLSGDGVATLETEETPVGAGSLIAIARGAPHALRAGPDGALEFAAILAPAFAPGHYLPESPAQEANL